MYFYEFVLFVLIAVKEDAKLNGAYQYHLVDPVLFSEMGKITFLIGFVNIGAFVALFLGTSVNQIGYYLESLKNLISVKKKILNFCAKKLSKSGSIKNSNFV